MKKLLNFIFLSVIISTYAQDFKPYKVKFGKITYEKLKYSTVSGYKWKNEKERNYSKQVPYVSEQVIYYWDQFGDIAFEEIYQVSKFGGELLPEKVKITERLWVGEHRYYYNIEENTIYDDPYHLRIKCKENFQYYQIKDSWIETLHMGAKTSGTKEILGKDSDYYKIDNYQDLYVWKGLLLKTEYFSTNRKGKRLYPDRTKIAIEIDTTSAINQELFNPIWLKREKLYNLLDENKIVELLDARPDVTEQADNIEGIQLQKNDILLFVTSKLTIGKMQVLGIDKNNQLNIKYNLYSYNNVLDWGNPFKIKNNAVVNIDNPHAQDSAVEDLDFKWSVNNKAMLLPQNNISILLLKPSRTKTLEI
ncbi:hypothetical protein [Lutibacter flavus]|uniref:Uncharacterized protein n=1 Tax=Lutibacter flavus TaxID=691689 RepID=A0A238X2P6_9FLAO|nr:hypothetical protein [Lutibacter flavus]SNR53167.1 hypothetical protein SAMN04488111_1516 [Lutibacter flavus]